MGFDPADYETVDSRIKRFYKDHPTGTILTDLLSSPNDIATVVVKATLVVDDCVCSNGMAFEKAGAGPVNQTSHLENCETSAIGRALANFNYSGDKRPSREEMEKVERGDSVAEDVPKAETMRKDLLKLLQDKLMDKYIDEKAYDEAVKWLGAFAHTTVAMTVAQTKLNERFKK